MLHLRPHDLTRIAALRSSRRLLEIQSGQVEALPGEEVLRRAGAEIS
jgi:hypothetical protein